MSSLRMVTYDSHATIHSSLPIYCFTIYTRDDDIVISTLRFKSIGFV